MPLGTEVGLGPDDIVLDGCPAPPPQNGGKAPNFRPIFIVAKPLDASRCHLVWRWASAQGTLLDGDPASLPQTGWSPQFSAHVFCGQTATWTKMPLGTDVGLVPDDIVLDRDPASPFQKGGGAPPQFSAHVYCGQTAG